MSEPRAAKQGLAEEFEILLCEDNLRHREIYAQAITAHLPASVSFANDGASALAALQARKPPDLLILDLEMPTINSEEVLAHIKSDHRLRFTPVIILTGQSGHDLQMEMLDKGADDFIEKGSPPEILIARLRALMRHKIAVDRLERTALERDLFAAGVLQDIGSVRGAIMSLCRTAKDKLAIDPVKKRQDILDCLDKLATHASKLGQYAAGVIQSVRDTHRTAVVSPQSPEAMIDWVKDIMNVDGSDKAKQLSWTIQEGMRHVLADQNFLRMALLNIVQHILESSTQRPIALHVHQEIYDEGPNAMGRQNAALIIHDLEAKIPKQDLDRLFLAYTRGSTHASFNLGLSLVAKVMAKMNGHARADKIASGGVAYRLDLPLAP